MGAPQLQQSTLKELSACASSKGAESEYVALVCGIKGLEGSATGVSMSIDIVSPGSLEIHWLCKVDTVCIPGEISGRITELEW